MRYGSMRLRALLASTTILASLAIPTAGNAQPADVLPGWDLFQTAPGTSFPGLGALQGVPVASYNFGGSIGTHSVGNTDTIVQRLDTASVASTPGTAPSISLLVNQLQLETVTPVNFLGFGLNNYFVTLQSNRPDGGTPSIGAMTISFANTMGGTFTSALDIFFDVRQGSLTGPIEYSTDAVLTNAGASWTRLPPPGSETINGVDVNLNGHDTTEDFWPGEITEMHPGGGFHNVQPASNDTPEFSTVAMMVSGSGGLLLQLMRHRRARKAA